MAMEFLLLYLIYGAILGGFCAYLASQKGRNSTSWFFLGLVFGIISLLVLIGLPNERRSPTSVTHPEDSPENDEWDFLEDEQPRTWRSYLLPAGIGLVPLIAAFLGALASESGGGVVSGVEGVQSKATTFLDNFGTSLQLGFAFVAGMVSTVNPCGFPMLPAYLGLYLSSEETDGGGRGTSRVAASTLRGLVVGSVVASGMVALFGGVGLVVTGGAQVVIDAMPYIGLIIGILLTFAGAWMLSGGKIYTALAGQAAAGIGDPTKVSVRGYFLFGLSYGLASLSCTLPIFLAVTGLSVASKGFVESAGQFLVYALGMGSVIVLLTLAISVFKGAMVGALRATLPYIQPVSAVLMLAAGAYIVFYWLTLGDLIDKLS